MGWQGAPAHRGPPGVSLLISANMPFSPVADELSRSGSNASDVGSACERCRENSALRVAAAPTLSPCTRPVFSKRSRGVIFRSEGREHNVSGGGEATGVFKKRGAA